MFMSAADYRESLRRYSPRVFIDGHAVESVADDPRLAPGIAALGVSYDFAKNPAHAPLMIAQSNGGAGVPRMLAIDASSTDLLYKLEAVRLLCRRCGCAQRYLSHDALNACFEATQAADAAHGTDYHQRLLAYLERVQEEDLALGIAMTDAKGDRSKRPSEQQNPDVYVHIAERRKDGIVIRGAKAIVTAAPYVHEFLVMPCRRMRPGRFRVRGLLRRAGRCRRRDRCGTAGGPSGRGRGEIFGALRTIDRRRAVRGRVRAVGAGVSRRRVRGGGGADHLLCDASPPFLHRRARRVRRSLDRRRRADDRGERARSRAPRPRARRHG